MLGKNSNGISRIKAARGLDGFSSQGLGNLAWSYAKQAQLIETAPRNISENSGRLAVYEASCRDIGGMLIGSKCCLLFLHFLFLLIINTPFLFSYRIAY